MICPKCKQDVPEGSVFCNHCGKKLVTQKTGGVKVRGNGMGTAFKRGKTWTACVTVGWILPDDPGKPKRPVRRTKGGFPTKKEAIAYCPQLLAHGDEVRQITMQQLWNEWSTMYAPRVGKSTMDNYLYAYKHFRPLHGMYMDRISSDDLQRCMDDCPSGKRTHQNMKCVAGLLWGYAFDHNIVDKDITDNLYIGKGSSVQREALTPEEEKVICNSIGKIRYAEYVISLLYLGYRPGEFLQLRKDQLFFAVLHDDETGEDIPVWYFVNGKKTDAGRDRIVIVPDQILEMVLARTYVPGTDLMFPQYAFNRKQPPEFKGFKQMSDAYFREEVFKPMMQQLGIAEGKVPYATRHSYADKLKDATGSDRDKASLIGHSQYLFTQKHYQSTHLKDLKTLVDSFK